VVSLAADDSRRARTGASAGGGDVTLSPLAAAPRATSASSGGSRHTAHSLAGAMLPSNAGVLGKGGVSRSEGGGCSVMGIHASSSRHSPPAKKNKSAVERGSGGAVAAGADAGDGDAAGSSGGGGVARPGGGCHARGRGGSGPRMAVAAETELCEGEFADSAEEEEKVFFFWLIARRSRRRVRVWSLYRSYVCPHTTSRRYICVLILLLDAIYVSSYYC
jgi:hypothetical protein